MAGSRRTRHKWRAKWCITPVDSAPESTGVMHHLARHLWRVRRLPAINGGLYALTYFQFASNEVFKRFPAPYQTIILAVDKDFRGAWPAVIVGTHSHAISPRAE